MESGVRKMDKKEKDCSIVFAIQLLIALANLGLFGLMFLAMGYYELIGADPAYFDEGTINNLKLINSVTNLVGIEIDPTKPHRVSTLGWAIALGIALLSSFFCIVIANRKPMEAYETT